MNEKNKKNDSSECYQALQALVYLGNQLTTKGTIKTGEGRIRAGESF